MNVVGKVGSFLSQGVYSVATPFHPFGGAIDIVVVQQQDGGFRSTPWYVRFGKFQGVLKGAEKVVRISVNGIEADFHMYLDNSGEAYFVREIDSAEESQSGRFEDVPDGLRATESFGGYEDRTSGVAGLSRLEHSVSDSVAVQVRNEFDSSGICRIDRSESDADRKFYDFQDENSSDDGSLEISEYGSNRLGGFDGDNFTESQGSSAEMVLVSVDGHILTAPISASEQNAEDLPLNTPRFHLGPGESTDFCEGNEDLDPAADLWVSDHVTSHTLEGLDESDNKCVVDPTNSSQVVNVVLANDEHACQTERPPANNSDCDGGTQNDVEDAFRRTKREDIFKSCLELPDLANRDGSAESDITSSPSKAGNLPDKSPQSLLEVADSYDDKRPAVTSEDGVSPSHLLSEERPPPFNVGVEQQTIEIKGYTRSVSISDHSHGSQGLEDGLLNTSVVGEAAKSSRHVKLPEEECDHHGRAPSVNTESNDEPGARTTARFEISLCRNELQAGIGLTAAAEAFKEHQISADEFLYSSASIMQNENLVVRYRDLYLTWEKAAPIVLGLATFGLEMPIEPKHAIQVEIEEMLKPDDGVLTPGSSGRRWSLWPIPFRRVKTLQHESSNSSSEELFVDTESSSQNVATTSANLESKSPRKQVRTNVPTNDQIASLNLKEGQNVVTFSFSTRVLGKQQVDAHIYLWMWNAKIVISDVDGTITKSDVLGQFMPLVGRDWTQSGVARLFSAIKENGYQLLFLSARAIVQAYLTRSFLLNLKQDGKNMPNGPVVISPDGLFPSLYREVIRRAPHEFKIACLEDIKALFPADHNPFYAGFGNRDTDELSYRKIGIPKGKIFIINPKGEVAISHRIDVKSYTSLHTLVNDMFPPTSMVEQEDYNSWNYWKVPIPEIEL
ncbi:hypothetical protein MLD38_040753 [Melastoma candidum]|nr:hypothetical protein MLD38_040753 [Melastoma candidum]